MRIVRTIEKSLIKSLEESNNILIEGLPFIDKKFLIESLLSEGKFGCYKCDLNNYSHIDKLTSYLSENSQRKGDKNSKKNVLILHIEKNIGLLKTLLNQNNADFRYIFVSDVILDGFQNSSNLDVFMIKPLNFLEFLYSCGLKKDDLEKYKNRAFESINEENELTSKLYSLLDVYSLIGGIPKCVDVYLSSGNLNKALKARDEAYAEFNESFLSLCAASLMSSDAKDINAIRNAKKAFESIPPYLSSDSYDYKFSFISPSSRKDSYISSFNWIRNNGYVCLSTRANPFVPATNAEANSFKAYLPDIGLEMSALKVNDINPHNGRLIDLLIADSLFKNGASLEYIFDSKTHEKVDCVALRDGHYEIYKTSGDKKCASLYSKTASVLNASNVYNVMYDTKGKNQKEPFKNVDVLDVMLSICESENNAHQKEKEDIQAIEIDPDSFLS